jgi:hypothetical protein
MGFEILQEKLGWPDQKEIFHPQGKGIQITHSYIQEKIKRNIDRNDLRVGVLTNNPKSQNTEAIFSIICEFKRPIYYT